MIIMRLALRLKKPKVNSLILFGGRRVAGSW
jgi:hypothetical protein